MEGETCFICWVKLGRGNMSVVGRQEKMDKLVSVSNTVEHSTTIISDILSRILNETVMREEGVCRICYNLLNDIDYHLKEAQEKTDEVTAKFLDREKNPHMYNPDLVQNKKPKMEEAKFRSRSPVYLKKKEVATSTIQLVPLVNQSKTRGNKRPEPVMELESSTDEMTVNSLAEKKRKLLSRVLQPSRRARPASRDREDLDTEEENKLTIDMSSQKITRERRRKERKRRRKEKRLKLSRKERRHYNETEEERQQDSDDDEGGQSDEEINVPPSPTEPVHLSSSKRSTVDLATKRSTVDLANKRSTVDLATVDLTQLGDLFSLSPVQSNKGTINTHVNTRPLEALVTTHVNTRPLVTTHDNARPLVTTHGNIRPVVTTHLFTTEQVVTTQPMVTTQLNTQINPNLVVTHQISSKPLVNPEATHHQPEATAITESRVFAKKSNPLEGGREEMETINLENLAPIYILPDNNDNSATISQEVPIIDCNALTQQTEAKMKIETTSMKIDTVSPRKMLPPSSQDTNEKKSPGTPSIPCPQCDKMFMRGYNMRVHIDRVHNKVKPWQCQFCEKSFATTSDLKQHLSSHGMGKIHKCEDCGREFNNRDSAILHRKQHNNERTHFCQDCGKGFFKASCLQRHMRSHTGEKPYSCEFCGRGFSQVTTAKNHKKVCKAAERAVEMANIAVEEDIVERKIIPVS